MNILEDRIRALRERWAQTLPDRVASIEGMLTHAAECGCDRAELLRQFHSLAGTASTFGYDDIAALAWDAEYFLSMPSVPEVTPAEVEHLVAGLVDLETVVRRHVEVGTFEGGGVV
jgi:chemotaxis protein histidine kinase CheA